MSNYGYFDDEAREYVITRPDTPQPWTNYSGDRTYGAIYSNNAAGYSFTQSPATGRLLRYSYLLPPSSQPGRFFYLRDSADGDFWSGSWMPVRKPLAEYESTCRMGTAYTVIESRYREIATKATYFVPLNQKFEYWILKVTNEGDTPRTLDCFSYAEFSSVWDVTHDVHNQQYANAITSCSWKDDMISSGNMVNLPVLEDDFGERHQSRWLYMMQAGDTKVDHYDLDRDSFLGAGGYAAPKGVMAGRCSGSSAYGDTACGAMQSKLELAPGESKTIVILLGVGTAKNVGSAVRAEYASVERAADELEKLKKHWHGLLGHLSVETPDPAFNSMINVWSAYNSLMTFEWSRSCSLVYAGLGRDGFGYRDTVQDILGVLHSIPEQARERLLLMISGQESLGGAQPVVDPVFFKPGEMARVDPAIQRADDCMWLFNTVPAYVAESGDFDFYNEIVPYADGGEDTVYGHLRQALNFSLNRMGKHGLACGLLADWNDCIVLGPNGESIFVSMQLRLGLKLFSELAAEYDKEEDIEWADANLKELDAALQKHGWDGDWFVRAFPEDAEVFGSSQSEEGQIFLNPQSWSIISGCATPEQAESAMQNVDDHLATDFGLMLHTSAYQKISRDLMHNVVYLPGTKENAAIFQHTQGWAVIADCMLGNGDRAYRHFRSYLPAAQNDMADLRQTEPYVYAQWTHAAESPREGTSRVPWLSGTATWSYFAATQYILGLRPEKDGLRIDPCIPSEWKSFTMERVFREKRIFITVRNPNGVEKGVKRLVLANGNSIEGSLLPLDEIEDGMKIEVEMSEC